jgi:hypothetical protein
MTKAVALALVLSACASPIVMHELAYEQSDLPHRAVIEIRYRNNSAHQICVDPYAWPNSAGAISDADARAFLEVDSRRFPMKLFNSGYCIGDHCSTRIKPGQELVAYLPYDAFDLPEDLTFARKRFIFTVGGYECQ